MTTNLQDYNELKILLKNWDFFKETQTNHRNVIWLIIIVWWIIPLNILTFIKVLPTKVWFITINIYDDSPIAKVFVSAVSMFVIILLHHYIMKLQKNYRNMLALYTSEVLDS